GLLSNWKSSRLQPVHDAEKLAPISVVEQDTLKQSAVEGPITGTALNNGSAQTFSPGQQSLRVSFTDAAGALAIAQTLSSGQQSLHQSGIGFSVGQISPHESGINQLPAMFSNVQTLQPPGSQPLAPTTGLAHTHNLFVSQPLQPMAGPTSSPTLQPFVPIAMPGQSQTNWQTMSFQGGPPPFVQAPPGQGKQSKGHKKKRSFPIWARV